MDNPQRAEDIAVSQESIESSHGHIATRKALMHHDIAQLHE